MRDGCAARSLAAGEAPCGTASRARRWVLLEHPGAWGADVLRDGTLPPAIATQLRALSRDLPARVLLIRRPPDRARPAGTGRTLLVGHSGPHRWWLERLELGRSDDLFDVDLTPLSTGAAVGGAPVTDPTYLVCTNGKHDACCAEHGRPLVAALADSPVADRTWECSHVGGDRFAANLVCLPEGSFYGRVTPDAAPSLIAAHEAGRMDLDRWRGWSSLPFDVQAAEGLVRRARGWDRVGDLRWEGTRRFDGRVEVTFARPGGGTIAATVRTTRAAEARPMTCSGEPSHPPEHELLAVEDVPGSQE